MKRWVDHLTSISANHLIEKGGYYGDHMLPGPAPGSEEFLSKETPPALIWTEYYYNNVWIMAQAAQILGLTDDASAYGQLADAIRTAINGKWLHASGKYYATNSQTANISALAFGVVPEANRQGVLNSLTTDILEKRHGHLQTGNFGTSCIMDALPDLGRADVLHRVATATD
jgi:alpha-L-rhamnosidase